MPDPLETVIETALEPGRFISHGDAPAFVGRVDSAGAEIGKLLDSDPLRAARLLETFLAACQAKAEEIDDSMGLFGELVGGLALGWIRCRQAAKADPVETVATLFRWRAADEYGLFSDLPKRAADVLDRRGLDALVAEAGRRREEAAPDSWDRKKDEETLKAVHLKRCDQAAYSEMCPHPTAKDCDDLATICLRDGRPVDALAWIDRGLASGDRNTWRLPQRRREVLVQLGRAAEAVASAWKEYEERPSRSTHEELFLYVPDWERRAWREKAVEMVAQHPDLAAALEVLTFTGEVDRLAERVEAAPRERLEAVHSTILEPAGYALSSRPAAAAKVRTALALRILSQKRTEEYPDAHRHLEAVRDQLLGLGRDRDWLALVEEIRDAHHRKKAFMPGFERIVSGWKSSEEPSFLEKARARWEKRTKR